MRYGISTLVQLSASLIESRALGKSLQKRWFNLIGLSPLRNAVFEFALL